MDRHQIEKIKRRKKRRKRVIDDHERRKAEENSFFNNHLKAAKKTVEETRYNLSSDSGCRLSLGIFCNGKRSYEDKEKEPRQHDNLPPKKKIRLQATTSTPVDDSDDDCMNNFGKASNQYLNQMFPKLSISACESAAALRKQATVQASKKGYLQVLAKETAIKIRAAKDFEHANRRFPSEERYRNEANDVLRIEPDFQHFPATFSETMEIHKRKSNPPFNARMVECLDYEKMRNPTDRSSEFPRDFHAIHSIDSVILAEHNKRSRAQCHSNNLIEFDHPPIPNVVIPKESNSYLDKIARHQEQRSEMDYIHPLWDTPNEIKALDFNESRCLEFYSTDNDHQSQRRNAFNYHPMQHRHNGFSHYSKLNENIKDLGYLRSEANLHLMGAVQ